MQSYVVLGADFAIIVAAPHFGTRPECNSTIIAVILRPFLFHKARTALLVVLSVVTAAYTALIVYDYRVAGDYSPTAPPMDHDIVLPANGHGSRRDRTQIQPFADHRQPETRHRQPSRFDGRIFVTVFLIIGFSVVVITNTELLINKNRVKDDQRWSFGQILPLFLTILTISNTIKAFGHHGFGPKPRRIKNQMPS